MAHQIVVQDPDAHVFYDVDWEDWLVARGFLADGSEIVSITWLEDGGAFAVTNKTFQALTGAVARVWIKGVPKGTTVLITSRVTMPEPDAGAGAVTNDFSFKVKGVER